MAQDVVGDEAQGQSDTEPSDGPGQGQTDAERAAALKDAAIELGTAIALGLVPYLGQAIDLYDTVASLWAQHGAKEGEAKDDAKFDTVLALIGWIPGPGDGVKKSLRLVNKDPRRYAPILFDLLRKVLEICQIDTSPEALLDELFDAGKLRASLDDIRTAIEQSPLFQKLSPEAQDTLRRMMRIVQAELPAMVGIVQRRLLKWRRMQRNSSARVAAASQRNKTDKPGGKHPETAKEGQDGANHGAAGTVANAQLATEALEVLQNQLIGILGEHIADYHCLHEFGWGKGNWSDHDRGRDGSWNGGEPDRMREGKLSRGAGARYGKLYRLDETANPKGIDAVWRAKANNHSKPYAVVEAKSDRELLIPRAVKKNPNFKPSMVSKLGITGIPKGEEMLEPYEDDAPAKPGGKPGGKPSAGKPRAGQQAKPKKNDVARIMVQMSHEWIRLNMSRAVGAVARDILRALPGDQKNYARHLLYTSQWMPCGKEHAEAYKNQTNENEATHRDHEIPSIGVYDETKVKQFVNKKKAALRKKYGDQPTLKAEI
jgi:hypothetical protein